MYAIDPTVVPHSVPAAPSREWSVEEMAQLQAEAVESLTSEMRHAEYGGGAPSGPSAYTGPAVAAPATTGGPAHHPDGSSAAASGRDGSAQRTSLCGRYRGTRADVELELRIDVDGVRPTRRVSGDFFRRTGATLAYVGSFIVHTPQISIRDARVVIEGTGVFSFQSGAPRVRLTVARVPALMPRAAVGVQFLTPGGIPGATFECAYESAFFRSVEFEQDVVQNVTAFDSYDTALLPSGGPPRVLRITDAFAEAGVEMIDTGGANVVPISLAGADATWTNSELHAAMVDQFGRWTPDAAWRVWLLAATEHELGSSLRGIMFDQARHQGCAIFHGVVGGSGSQLDRAMLRTYVHELGHCFNLYHSHQKRFMHPPQPDRLDALSWMHYPAYYRSPGGSGENAYWRRFPFQFDDEELVHLRHGFRDAVIPGGQTFGLGAADFDRGAFADNVEDNSGLALELRAPRSAALGTPVVVELKLALTDLRGRMANALLHPNFGFVQIGIARVGGKTVTYRPLLTHCAEPQLVALEPDRPSVYESAFIGYGKDGFYFDAPGQYELRAVYRGPDGSSVLSNVVRLRVRAPGGSADETVAELFLGDEQGTLLYLLGSDSDTLKSGRAAFAEVLRRHSLHPLATYACLVEGMNASRPFKTIERGCVRPRPPVDADADGNDSVGLLSRVEKATTSRGPAPHKDTATPQRGVPRLDDISLNMVMQRLATALLRRGEQEAAAGTAERAIRHFDAQGVPPHVRQRIVEQFKAFLPEDRFADLSSGPRAVAPPSS